MPAPKTIFIPYSCFGYYDGEFEECARKCKHCKECKRATESDRRDEVRSIFKYKTSQIDDLVREFGKEWKKEPKSE